MPQKKSEEVWLHAQQFLHFFIDLDSLCAEILFEWPKNMVVRNNEVT
jgi:hypothetical protein